MMTEQPTWRSSSYSENGGQCVEVTPSRAATTGAVPGRDSKNPTGPVLTVTDDAFTHFVNGLTSDAFDR
ncbi:DUF397 domain-containing protein [Streptomyces bohaiensis]|uniref:DUF397 domain-containing protein n=2 Tax=Streptomyces bohaiensis TaxID=1431344 RepID=A0ABX1CDT6_9ACTN|nr:DUF397 domain-containing protein [Streptomyces bohaiensis]NJQ15367.1 DUF397 domain-containing protein [Streptomyces bohaiensis]